MLAAIFSDLHIHNHRQFKSKVDRLENCLEVIRIIFKFCHKNNISVILFSGDIYENQKMLPTSVINRTIQLFSEMFEEYPDIRFYAISGNHDHATKNTPENPAVTALDHLHAAFPQFHLIDNSVVYLSDSICVSGIPYYEYPEHFENMLSNRIRIAYGQAGQRNYLLMHQTPSDMGNPNIPVDMDIHSDNVKFFDYVFNGHIHTRAQLSDKFLNVGSPLHKDGSDVGQKKGFIVMDLEYPEDGWQFISLAGKFPEFIELPENSEVPEGVDKDFIIWREDKSSTTFQQEEEKISEFRADLTPDKLIENYWNEVDGKDQELLHVGIQLVK